MPKLKILCSVAPPIFHSNLPVWLSTAIVANTRTGVGTTCMSSIAVVVADADSVVIFMSTVNAVASTDFLLLSWMIPVLPSVVFQDH